MALATEKTDDAGAVSPTEGLTGRDEAKAHTLGLTSATGLVIGSIVGTGVFTMPAVLAGAGTMGIVVLASSPSGAMLLAVLFGQLTKRVPEQRRRAATPTPATSSATSPATSSAGATGSSRGPATPPSSSSWVFYVDALFGWSHIPAAWRTGASPWSACGCPAIDQPGRRPPDGLVPERHRGPQVPAPAVRRRRRLVLRRARPTSARSTPRAAASTAASASPPAWRCSPSSASRRRR